MSAQQKKHPFDFKTQYGLGFNQQDDEIVVDFFCGGGGAGTGLEMGLGRAVTVAKNHSPAAINMHTVNHPHAKHFTTDVFEGDPDTECGGRAVGWFHMSPDCTHHSQAAGGQPRKREIRNLSWVGLKWAGMKRPRVISLENVKQILQWGPLVAKRCKSTGRVIKLGGVIAQPGEVVPVSEQFLVPDPKRRGQTWEVFVAELQRLDYVVEWRVIKACDFGAPTSRERLFMIARCDGQPEDLRESPSIDHLHGVHSELMTKLFGYEWWHLADDATEPNPDYVYLERIILAVQQALSQEQQ